MTQDGLIDTCSFLVLPKVFLKRLLTRSLFMLAGSVFASPAFAQYQFDAWNTDNGLPQNLVKAILQTSDGYLWLTTSDGLVRFDGVRFTIFQRANSDGLTSTRLTTLVEDHLGNLWIGSEDRGLFKYRDGRFTNYTTADGLSDYLIKAFGEDTANNLWVLTMKGMDQWKDGRFIPYDPGIGPFKSPGATYADANNFMGFSFVDANGLSVFEGGRYRSYPSIEGFNVRNIRTLYEDQYGAVWIGATGRNATCINSRTAPSRLSRLIVCRMLQSRQSVRTTRETSGSAPGTAS